MIQNILGVLFILLGIVLGLYAGVWICFIGGITQIIEGIKSNPVNSLNIAIGILKFIVSGLVGWVSFAILFGIGYTLIEN